MWQKRQRSYKVGQAEEKKEEEEEVVGSRKLPHEG